MSTRTSAPRGLLTARSGWQPGATRGPRGVVALWDLDEVRAYAALTTYHHRTDSRPHIGGTHNTQEHTVMSYRPLVDAWQDSREDRTPLRPGGRRRGRWASLEHAVAGGTHRGDGYGIADTTPGRPRGPLCVDDAAIQDAENPNAYLTDFSHRGVPGEDRDQEEVGRRRGGRGELDLEDEIEGGAEEEIDGGAEEVDPEAGDDEEPAA